MTGIPPLTEFTVDDVTYTVGDVVTVGAGRSQWTITEFWYSATAEPMVSLAAVSGYSNTSVKVERLKARVVTS